MFDRATKILYRSTISADYDASPRPSLFRSSPPSDIALFGLFSALHAEIMMENPNLRRVARSRRAWNLFDLGNAALSSERKRQAIELAVQSLLLFPTRASLRLLIKAVIGHRRGSK
jgi:hypothetical protein